MGLAVVAAPVANAGPLPDAASQSALVMFVLPPTEPADNVAGDTFRGGCFFIAIEQPVLTNGVFEGITGAAAVATDAGNHPLDGTTTCTLRVNQRDIDQFNYRSLSGVTAGINQLNFNVMDGDVVELCQDVSFDVGRTLLKECTTATEIQVPPQAVVDTLTDAGLLADSFVCPLLRQVGNVTGGGVPGVLDIRADGDVIASALGVTLYDCPPYDY